MKTKNVNIKIKQHGMVNDAVLFLSYPEPCIIEIHLENNELTRESAEDFFSAFAKLRRELPEVTFLCKGAKKNVYPSQMTRQMGFGFRAYELEMGKQATFECLVDIFSFDNENISSDVNEQEEFYRNWLASL